MLLHGHLADCGECPYLPGRRFRAFLPEPNPPVGVGYRQLMDLRFRRSGSQVYRPMCVDCEECRPLRVRVADFAPRTDQRRTWRRNQDLVLSWQPRGADAERLGLYRRYQAQVHDRHDEEEPTPFLVSDGGVPGGELHARDAAGRLLAVSVCDRVDDALSSVYCYYDPAQPRRSLGTCMALGELAWAKDQGLTWWYPGFHVAGCGKMAYKARFGPAEILIEGAWTRLETATARKSGGAEERRGTGD